MKTTLFFLFLTFLLLCAVLLHAANNNREHILPEKPADQLTNIETKKEMQFLPNIILL